MAKAIDLSTVSPARAALLLKKRAAKAAEYQRRKAVLLARNKAWRDANPGLSSELAMRWKKANPERNAENKHRWYAENRELQLQRAAHAKETLTDSVVKSLYCAGTGLQSKDIPAELVPAIRTTILIKRELRDQKRELRRTDK